MITQHQGENGSCWINRIPKDCRSLPQAQVSRLQEDLEALDELSGCQFNEWPQV